MPPTTPKVKTRFTNTSGDKVTVLTDGTKTRVPATPVPAPTSTPTTDIPVGTIEGAATSLQLPPVPAVADTAPQAKTAAEQYLNQLQTDAQMRLQKSEQAGTESENRVRTLMGLQNTEADTRTKLEQARGVTGIENQMREAEQSIARQIAEIDAFDLQSVTDIEAMRIDASKRDLTKRTFGAQAAEFNLQRTVERAGMAASLRATVAGNLALQGNLEAATEQVDKALKAIYDPIRQGLEMEKFFLERNDARLGADRAEARDLRMKAIDRQFQEIDRAQSLSDSAVASGYAGPNEIKQLTALSGDPVRQAEFAQQIVARGAREMMALERAAKNASISASGLSARKSLMELALAGDPEAIKQLKFDPGAPARAEKNAELDRTLSKQIEKQNDVIERLTKVAGMTTAIKSSTGIVQNAFLAGLLPQKGVNEVPGIGSLPGGIKGGLSAMNDKAEFLTQMNYLLAGEGFQQFSKLKDEGVSLTPVSELEFNKIMASASMLSSAAEVKDGKIVGFGNLAPEAIVREINTMIASAAQIRDEKAAIKALGPDGYSQLLAIQQASK